MAAYTGALTRSAHFDFRPPVPGVDPQHEQAVEKPDIFAEVPDTPPAQTGDVWLPSDPSSQTEMRADRIHHTADGQQPVPSDVPSWQRDMAFQARMLAVHAAELFRPDTYPVYKHAGQGRHIEYVEGRAPVNAGSTVPDNMSYLVMGKNSYDQTNGTSEVYSAEPSGRYRLGARYENWGLYDFYTKQGQDAQLRAYTGLAPQFPVDKPAIADPTPSTPSSSGTTRWLSSAFQSPSLFSLPSETSMTDYETATEDQGAGGQFDDGGRM